MNKKFYDIITGVLIILIIIYLIIWIFNLRGLSISEYYSLIVIFYISFYVIMMILLIVREKKDNAFKALIILLSAFTGGIITSVYYFFYLRNEMNFIRNYGDNEKSILGFFISIYIIGIPAIAIAYSITKKKYFFVILGELIIFLIILTTIYFCYNVPPVKTKHNKLSYK